MMTEYLDELERQTQRADALTAEVERLTAENAALRAQLAAAEAERDDANREAAIDQRHAMESGAENLSLRAQLEALQNALDDAQLLADERGEELARGAGEGWRAVSDGRPLKADRYLVCDPEGWQSISWMAVAPEARSSKITHWRPLPAPPQE